MRRASWCAATAIRSQCRFPRPASAYRAKKQPSACLPQLRSRFRPHSPWTRERYRLSYDRAARFRRTSTFWEAYVQRFEPPQVSGDGSRRGCVHHRSATRPGRTRSGPAQRQNHPGLHRHGHAGPARDPAPAGRPRRSRSSPSATRASTPPAIATGRKDGLLNDLRRALGKPDWRAGQRSASFPAAATSGKNVVDTYYANQRAGDSFKGCSAYADYPRTVRKREGPERRQDHDARPSARRHQHGRHEARQARHHAQADRQPPEGSEDGRSIPRARPASPPTSCRGTPTARWSR